MALFLVLIISPVLILLLIITYFNFKCNPVFIQDRTVFGSSTFKFFKIRSMLKNAPNVPTSEFTDVEIYINRWGAFIRLFSIDEILNLFSIIAGDMKFIGPRPILNSEYELIKMRINNGITSKPGITGLAQINGRDEITISRKVACERYYQRNSKSLRLRLYILLKTIVIVVKKSGISH